MKKNKKKNIENDDDMSMTFISEVGQKSAIADDTLNDISGVVDVKVEPHDIEKKENNQDNDDYNMLNNNDPNKKGIIITIILMILCLAVGSMGTYFITDLSKKNTVKTENKEVKDNKKEEIKDEEVSPDSAYIKELISNYDNDSILSPFYKYYYSSEKTNIKDVDEDFLRLLVAQKANNSLVDASFSGEKFQDTVLLLYGEQIKLENSDISFDKGCIKLTYDEEEDTYSSRNGECGGTIPVSFNRKITKAVKKEDSIEVNVAISYTVGDAVYKDYDFEEKKGIEKLEDIDIETFNIDNDYADLNQFKYTFLYDKENLNYYLTTIEKIK